MSKKSKTTKDETTHQVVAPTNPQWVTDPVSTLAGKVSELSKVDPYSFVAGPNGLQNQAAAGAASLTPQTANFGAASDVLRRTMTAGPQSIQAQSLLDGLSNYMSPYLNDVLGSAMRDYDFGAGQTRAQNRLALAQDDAFGGSGGAIQTALSEDAIDRGRSSLSAQLRDQAFQTGASLSGQDAARRQDAAATNASLAEQAYARQQAGARGLMDLSTAYQDGQRQDIATQGSIGDMMRQIEAARQTAPISTLASEAGLLNSLPLSLFQGQVTDGTGHSVTKTKESDPIGAATSLATGLSGLLGAPWGGLSDTIGGAIGRKFKKPGT